MRPLRALVIYIAVVFIGGALLAPWLYRLAQAGAHSFPKIAGLSLIHISIWNSPATANVTNF